MYIALEVITVLFDISFLPIYSVNPVYSVSMEMT